MRERDCLAAALMACDFRHPLALVYGGSAGLLYGVNPAVGWLFAVALGLNRGSALVALAALAVGLALVGTGRARRSRHGLRLCATMGRLGPLPGCSAKLPFGTPA